MGTFAYVKFLAKSTNQHGVHSPFVFNLVTKGLSQKSKVIKEYTKKQHKKNKPINVSLTNLELITRISDFLKPSRIMLAESAPEAVKSCLKYGNNEAVIDSRQNFDSIAEEDKNTIYDFAYFHSLIDRQNATRIFYDCMSSTHSDSIIYFNNIRDTEETLTLWESFCQHPKATVSINLYDKGIICFRPEQEKEHFNIRI